MSVYRCNLNSIEKHQLFGSGVGSKGSALYLPAFHSRHHLFVPGGRKFSGRNNDQIEAGLWRQESKNSSRWIEGIDNDSVFRQGSEINHRLGGRGGWRERKGKRKKNWGKHFYRSKFFWRGLTAELSRFWFVEQTGSELINARVDGSEERLAMFSFSLTADWKKHIHKMEDAASTEASGCNASLVCERRDLWTACKFSLMSPCQDILLQGRKKSQHCWKCTGDFRQAFLNVSYDIFFFYLFYSALHMSVIIQQFCWPNCL